jgi:intracellular sulfur oxidation DsrE/DsrF family protein
MRKAQLILSVLVTSVPLLALNPARSETADNRAALTGLSEVKVAFDLTNGDPKQLLTYLNVIDETRQSLISQGVKPDFILTFRGPATRLVQTDLGVLKSEDREHASKIAERVSQLQTAPGITALEQCGVAVRMVGTKPENVLPQIKVVGNSWISLMAYQSKGYGYIAP